jgi:murein DD-endopeptidase MepM/ murein hydrolase activator NlpD
MQLETLLKDENTNFASVIDFTGQKLIPLDFTENNPKLKKIQLDDTKALAAIIRQELDAHDADIGYGGYGEDRIVYKRSKHFGTDENARSIHLGTDIWCPAKTPIHTPLKAKIHSFRINDNFGDYGPTIILEHQLKDTVFYTLYGHLSKQSLEAKQAGQELEKGEIFAEVGADDENGYWPPHLHFQIISDMQENWGDFPGVCNKNKKNDFLKICPDPKIILSI